MQFGKKIDQAIQYLLTLEVAHSQYKTGPGKHRLNIVESGQERPFIDTSLTGLAAQDNSFSLDASLKDQFEYIVGTDLSGVRIHTGVYAEELARRQEADAITVGSDIYFGSGKYAPDTEEGIALLAHELQHVVQTSRGDRHIYKEDIEGAEADASRVETQASGVSTDRNLLFAPDIVNTPAQGGSIPVPYPNIGGTSSTSDGSQRVEVNNKETPLQRASGGGSDGGGSLDDFVGQRNDVLYEVILKDGTKLDLSKGDMESLYSAFENKVAIWLRNIKNEYTEKEYEQKILRFLDVISSG